MTTTITAADRTFWNTASAALKNRIISVTANHVMDPDSTKAVSVAKIANLTGNKALATRIFDSVIKRPAQGTTSR